ncbi:MAG: squalene/phytoene synthase family protein [Rhodospirillales bacterium]|nr:squalene/phytoene synthase family protein [Rhodospirillales bacterium]
MAGLSHCASEVRRHDPDRFACALFAPAEAREAIHAVHAFSLEIARVREMVHEPLVGRMRLQWWRDTLAAIARGEPTAHPVARALADAIRRYRLPRDPFERLIDARERDLANDPPADMAELIRYAEATSSTLVEQGLHVLGADTGAAGAAGRNVGIAWALAGLLRAVPFHGAQRRSYLPAAEARKAGLNVDRLYDGRPGPGLAAVVADVARVAREHLAAARAQRHDVPRAGVPALLPATLAERYLNALAASGWNPFDARVQHAGAGRLVRLFFNAMRGRY